MAKAGFGATLLLTGVKSSPLGKAASFRSTLIKPNFQYIQKVEQSKAKEDYGTLVIAGVDPPKRFSPR